MERRWPVKILPVAAFLFLFTTDLFLFTTDLTAYAQTPLGSELRQGVAGPGSGEAALQRLQTAFEQGDVSGLIDHTARRIDVTLFGANELFSRSQASYVIKEFFREYHPKRVVFNETSGRGVNWFAAGRYWYGDEDAPLSIYMRLRQRDGRWELRELRIERGQDR